jgi:hypothetical protein
MVLVVIRIRRKLILGFAIDRLIGRRVHPYIMRRFHGVGRYSRSRRAEGVVKLTVRFASMSMVRN